MTPTTNEQQELFELWNPVVEYEGLYEVSNLGRVRSLSGRKGTSGKILKQGSIKGYACVSLSKVGKTSTRLVHRLVAMSHIDSINLLPEVNHLDGDKLNNTYTNLEWTDRDGNMRHASGTGLVDNKGEAHGMHKLKEADVRYILQPSNETNHRLAQRFNISEQTVSDIKLGRSWKHLHDAGVKL